LTLTLGEAAELSGTVISMRGEHVDRMSIGEFARRSRLSAKALRLYDELGPLPPARVDEDSGYRFYEPGQLKQARLIAALRQLHVPLAEINAIMPLEPVQAAERVGELWAATEAGHTTRRALAAYLIDELSGKRHAIMTSTHGTSPPEASCRSNATSKEWTPRGRSARSSSPCFGSTSCRTYRGAPGAFFCIYWGEGSDDSDGPMEWCRPIPADEAEALAARCPELTLRAEPAHQEAFVKIGDGQIDGADWQMVSRSLEAWSEQRPDILPADLGVRITYLPSEAGQDTYQDFAVPFDGRSRE
jgi:DNA-binding transcriptional MerR regulator